MVKPTQPGRGRPKRSSDIPLAGSRRLDRSSDVPLYFQLAAALKVMLEVGAWQAGARFASEREIEEEFGVSRAVIRPALDLLVGDGAIVRVKGSGAFVAPARHEVHVTGLVRLSLEGFADRAITVLSARKRRPDRTVSHFLEIEDRRTPIAHVTAVVDVDQPSVFIIDSYSSVAQVPWLLSIAEALEAGSKPPKPSKLDLTRATVSIEHTFFGEWGSSQVGAAAGDPALMGRFVQFGRIKGSKRERPLEFARLVYRADSAELAFELS
ncbi:MAG: GntR family transcriptional regulator [Solirubrobacterales bacterium]|jgi:DNA-binding GntR family transcriptional regulator|nr:GntR family transcriptional regulator [Solirubrobacterales bacterium]